MKKIYIILMTMTFQASYAGGSNENVIQPIANHTGVLFFHANSKVNTPNCGLPQPERWAIDTSTPGGKTMAALVMTAFALGKSVAVTGAENCDIWGDTESVDYLFISN